MDLDSASERLGASQKGDVTVNTEDADQQALKKEQDNQDKQKAANDSDLRVVAEPEGTEGIAENKYSAGLGLQTWNEVTSILQTNQTYFCSNISRNCWSKVRQRRKLSRGLEPFAVTTIISY